MVLQTTQGEKTSYSTSDAGKTGHPRTEMKVGLCPTPSREISSGGLKP